MLFKKRKDYLLVKHFSLTRDRQTSQTKGGSLMHKIREEILINKTIFVGLEDSKKTWKLNIRCDKMRVFRGSMPANFDILIQFFKNKFPKCKINLMYEAGFRGFWLYDKLEAAGIHCVVIPPHMLTEEKGNKVKTDKRDAARIAKVLENEDFKTSCAIPEIERREDRQISRTICSLQKELKATKNRIKHFFHFHGINPQLPDKTWTDKQYMSLSKLKLPEMLKVSLDSYLRVLTLLNDELKHLFKVLKKLMLKPAYAKAVKVYQSAPGIGWLTAIRLALEWGDLNRFSSGKKFASFLGFGCGEFSTAENCHKGKITKQGNGFTRSWLIESAWTAIGKDPVLLDKFKRVASSSKRKNIAIVAVARQLAVRLRSAYINDTKYILGVVK